MRSAGDLINRTAVLNWWAGRSACASRNRARAPKRSTWRPTRLRCRPRRRYEGTYMGPTAASRSPAAERFTGAQRRHGGAGAGGLRRGARTSLGLAGAGLLLTKSLSTAQPPAVAIAAGWMQADGLFNLALVGRGVHGDHGRPVDRIYPRERFFRVLSGRSSRLVGASAGQLHGLLQSVRPGRTGEIGPLGSATLAGRAAAWRRPCTPRSSSASAGRDLWRRRCCPAFAGSRLAGQCRYWRF